MATVVVFALRKRTPVEPEGRLHAVAELEERRRRERWLERIRLLEASVDTSSYAVQFFEWDVGGEETWDRFKWGQGPIDVTDPT